MTTQYDAATLMAADKIEKARIELISARRFYGVLVSNVQPVPSRKYPTMATNGKLHYFNPEFINSLPQEQVLGTQVHESEHDARRHHTRRMGRDPLKWNEACDYAINGDIIAEGFKLPNGFLFEQRFVGLSAEDIYRIREIEEAQQQQQPQPQPQPQDDEGDDDSQQAGDDDSSDEAGDDKGDAGDEAGDDKGDAGDEAGDDSEAGDEPGEAGDQPGDEGTEGSEAAGEAAGEGEAGEGTEDAPTGGTEAGEPGDQPGESAEQPTSGDPGGCGEVLDAEGDDTEQVEQDMQWERIVKMAATIGKGDLPGHISREIERSNQPGRDWREELRAWLESGSHRLETWNKRNRRFASGGLILPGSRKEGIRKAALLIDTSGSMDDVALQCVRVETQAALDDGIIDEVVVVYGDTRVTRVDEYQTGDEMEFDPRGGGGTRLRPLFDYVEEQHSDASLIICFTDMEFGDLGREPAVPVLFAATGYPDKVRRYLANAPWNSPGIDVGAH